MNIQSQQYFQLIEGHIVDFEKGQLKLGQLVNALEELIDNIEYDEEWKELFRTEWWTLEQVYAVSLVSGDNNLRPESKSFVDEAIENMKSLLKNIHNINNQGYNII